MKKTSLFSSPVRTEDFDELYEINKEKEYSNYKKGEVFLKKFYKDFCNRSGISWNRKWKKSIYSKN